MEHRRGMIISLAACFAAIGIAIALSYTFDPEVREASSAEFCLNGVKHIANIDNNGRLVGYRTKNNDGEPEFCSMK
jgi:hypothetical protein